MIARAVARLVPDCIVLFRRLLADLRVPRRKKAMLVVLVGYLDGAVVVAFVLELVMRLASLSP